MGVAEGLREAEIEDVVVERGERDAGVEVAAGDALPGGGEGGLMAVCRRVSTFSNPAQSASSHREQSTTRPRGA